MMIRAAGGPGAVSPIDFGERKKPLPRWMWAAIGLSVLAHVGAGVVLYNQRFQLKAPDVAPPAPPPTIVTLDLPRPKPLPHAAVEYMHQYPYQPYNNKYNTILVPHEFSLTVQCSVTVS